jgi:hypothetical protein
MPPFPRVVVIPAQAEEPLLASFPSTIRIRLMRGFGSELAPEMLESENPDPFSTFEKFVSRETSNWLATPGSPQAVISEQLKFERAENVIRERYRERHDTSLTSKFEVFRRYFEQTMGAIGAFKSTTATAISSEILASLA